MTKAKTRFNHENVTKTLFRVSFPIMFMSLLFASFFFVDSLMIAHFVKYDDGRTGAAVLGMVTPITTFFFSFITIWIVGNALNYTKLLAQDNPEAARQSASQAIMMSIVGGLSLSMIVALIAKPYMNWVGGKGTAPLTQEQIQDGINYIIVFAFCYPLFSIEDTFIRTQRAEGKGLSSIIFPVISVFINILFNWIFMGVIGTGIYGAALALMVALATTVAGAFLYSIYLRKKGEIELQIVPKYMKPNWPLITVIVGFGIVSVVRRIAFSYNSLLISIFISQMGEGWKEWVTSATVTANMLNQISLGMLQGTAMLLSYWYNSGQKKAAKEVMWKGFVFVIGIQFVVAGVMMLTGSQILSLFDVPGEMKFLRSYYLVALMLIASAAVTFGPFMYASLKDGKSSMAHIVIWIIVVTIFQFSFFYGFDAAKPGNEILYIMSLPISLFAAWIFTLPIIITKYKSI